MVHRAPAASLVHFARSEVQPPGALYVSNDDRLLIRTRGEAGFARVNLTARLLNPEGELQLLRYEHVAGQGSTRATDVFGLTEGYLLGVTAAAVEATVVQGLLYCQVFLLRGGEAAKVETQLLTRGYLASFMPLSWPGGPTDAGLTGPGRLASTGGADPAAGVEASILNSLIRRRRVYSFIVTLVTSAVAGNRRPSLVLDDTVAVRWRVPVNTDIPASTTTILTWGTLGAAGGTLAALYAPLPAGRWWAPGWTLRTVTEGLDVGDNYNAPQVVVEEWVEP